jgi:threonine aldolase
VDLMCVENTHGFGGGTVMPVDELRAIRKVAGEAGVPLYMDGARIFNASAASGTPVIDYANEVDALMFCLSKGLGAPIGSVLCGNAEFIREARRARVLFGGAWRQAGIMAAAGMIALEEGPKRLHEDHANARRLAEGLIDATPEAVDMEAVQTNMVFVEAASAGMSSVALMDRLREAGVLANAMGARVRFVTHRDVTAADVERTIAVWRAVAA